MPKANYDGRMHEKKTKKDLSILPSLSPRDNEDSHTLPAHRFSVDVSKKKRDEPSLSQIRANDVLQSLDNRKKKSIV
jgi:hypothetical protein